MARRRGRVLDEHILELLTESDVEDFSPSDDDNGDPPYTQETNGTEETTSDSDLTDDLEVPVNRNTEPRGNRGRSRGRGRGTDSYRGRGHQQLVLPSSPSTSGSTEWLIKDFPAVEYTLLEPSYLPNSNNDFSKLKFYEQYIDQKFGELVVERTNQTSVALHGRSLNMSVKEFNIYSGITFVMAALNYPWLRMYWEAKWRVPIIADNMSRNRFTLLRNSLKVVYDGDVNEETRKIDKLWKMRPLISQIQQGCQIQEKDQRLSLDEMIIPFTGSCGVKQYCPGKPNPVGLKAFVLANPNGLVVDFVVYQGNTTYPQLETSNFGLGEKVVLSFADSLVPGHMLYFDRYFTTVKLAKELTERGIGCTGTIQKNRVPRDARSVLMDDKEIKKRDRGSVHNIVSKDGKIAIIKWFDNKPVTLLSNVDALEPMDMCQRWCKSRKQYLSVDRPAAVRNYNKYMGGVDLADRMLSVCPNRYRTKKWTQRFFSHKLDMTVSNSWLAYKSQEIEKGVHPKKVQQLRHFKMELGEALIDINSSSLDADSDSADLDPGPEPARRKRGKPSSTPMPSKISRSTAAKHMPSFEEKQARCRHCHYNLSRTKCTTCNIHLCLTKNRNCYTLFHQ